MGVASSDPLKPKAPQCLRKLPGLEFGLSGPRFGNLAAKVSVSALRVGFVNLRAKV